MGYRAGVRAQLEESAVAIESAYVSGSSLDELCELYGCSPTPLRALLKSRGVALRPNRRRHVLAGKEEQVRDLYEDGLSTREIAALLGVNRDTVGECVARLGIRRSRSLSGRTFHVESDRDRGVIAGLLLGEGSIVFRANGDPVVRIVNTDRDIIGWLAQFGGRVHWVKPRKGCPNPLGSWDIARQVDVLHFLREIGPLLVGVKREKADKALDLLCERHGFRHADTVPSVGNSRTLRSSGQVVMSAPLLSPKVDPICLTNAGTPASEHCRTT